MAYPVAVTVEPLLINRNRLTTAFRVILAIPHLILVGGLGLGGALRRGGDSAISFGGETGLLGAASLCLAVVRLILVLPHAIALVFLVLAWWLTAVLSWVLIVTTGEYPRGMYQFGVGVLRWFLRVESYMLLLVDTYPPFSLEA
jgi:hypothetical protein